MKKKIALVVAIIGGLLVAGWKIRRLKDLYRVKSPIEKIQES